MAENSNGYQVKVTLEDVRPPIWRRLLVRGDTRLGMLHDILQSTMGWWNSHLHQFISKGIRYGELHPDPSEWPEMEDEHDYSLEQLAPRVRSQFIYEYDFGDSWRHVLLVEKIMTPEEARDLHKGRLPVCLEGSRACPPEDVGGPPGYENFLDAMRDPAHSQHEDYRGWIGDEFDPEQFDLEAVNRALH